MSLVLEQGGGGGMGYRDCCGYFYRNYYRDPLFHSLLRVLVVVTSPYKGSTGKQKRNFRKVCGKMSLPDVASECEQIRLILKAGLGRV